MFRGPPGFAIIEREFEAGEEIVLSLPMEPRYSWPDPRIDAVRHCVAVERGPLVYCAESIDLPVDVPLDELAGDPSLPPARRGEQVAVRGVTGGDAPQRRGTWPYRRRVEPTAEAGATCTEVTLTPYHQWAERGPTAMRVWLPVTAGGST